MHPAIVAIDPSPRQPGVPSHRVRGRQDVQHGAGGTLPAGRGISSQEQGAADGAETRLESRAREEPGRAVPRECRGDLGERGSFLMRAISVQCVSPREQLVEFFADSPRCGRRSTPSCEVRRPHRPSGRPLQRSSFLRSCRPLAVRGRRPRHACPSRYGGRPPPPSRSRRPPEGGQGAVATPRGRQRQQPDRHNGYDGPEDQDASSCRHADRQVVTDASQTTG